MLLRINHTSEEGGMSPSEEASDPEPECPMTNYELCIVHYALD